MSFKTIEVHGYECARCGQLSEAASSESKDRPTGYFIHIRRVTDAHHHYISEELFLCSKDCLVDFVTYGISQNTWRVETF